MGESKRKQRQDEEMLVSCAGVQTAGGRVQVRWESRSAATPMGQLAYSSPNAPSKAEILGTWMRSIWSGHWRYAQVTAIRGDGVEFVLSEARQIGALREILAEQAIGFSLIPRCQKLRGSAK